MKKYDLIVLGAGPGGYVAAIRAAQLGGKVAIVEKDEVGGVCLNKGCIPTKALAKNAEIIHLMKSSKVRGIECGTPVLDIVQMIAYKDAVVKQLTQGVAGLLASNGVDLLRGKGTVHEDKTITVNDETYEFDKLIIAIGSENATPPIEGADHDILYSTELLKIDKIPESLAIIGGGVIGCEFASVFANLGTKVTIIELLPSIIPNIDKDVTAILLKSFRQAKIDVKTGHQVMRIEHNENSKTVVAKNSNGEEVRVEAEKIFMSVGRKANTEGIEELPLEKFKNYIKTDEKMETNIPGIYAIGDITGTIQLAHVASTQGMIAAENAMGGSKCADLTVVPSCIFTLPEIGSVGITEEKAREEYEEIKVGKFPAAALGKALAIGEPNGMFKIIADKKTDKILGAHIIGAGATDIIMEVAVAMKNGVTVEELADTIHAHPTMAEGVMECAHEVDGICIHLPKRR